MTRLRECFKLKIKNRQTWATSRADRNLIGNILIMDKISHFSSKKCQTFPSLHLFSRGYLPLFFLCDKKLNRLLVGQNKEFKDVTLGSRTLTQMLK